MGLAWAVFGVLRVVGYWGVRVSVFGIMVPAFTVILVGALFFHSIREIHAVEAVFKGIRPAVVALILAPVFTLSKGLGWWRLLLVPIAAVGVWYFSFSPVYLIIFGAVGGLFYGYLRGSRRDDSSAEDASQPEA